MLISVSCHGSNDLSLYLPFFPFLGVNDFCLIVSLSLPDLCCKVSALTLISCFPIICLVPYLLNFSEILLRMLLRMGLSVKKKSWLKAVLKSQLSSTGVSL